MKKNPWEWLYERRSQPLKAYVLDEVANTLAQAALSFPPQIEEWQNERDRIRWAPVLEQPQGPLPRSVVRLALKLYRWELEREVALIDAYLSQGHFEEHGRLSDLEKETALFLWRHWVDQTLAFKEYAQDKFRWSELLGLAERLESRWA